MYISDTYIVKYISAQLKTMFSCPDSQEEDEKIIHLALEDPKERYAHCASKIKFFKGEQEVDFFDVRKYPIFLYILANSIHQVGIDESGRIKDRLYCLNKYFHGCSLFYKIDLPPVFLVTYASQVILAKTVYGNYFMTYQGVTVGSFNNQVPIIGTKVILMPNVIISGSSVVGDNVVISAGVRVINEFVPDNKIIFQGAANSLIFKDNDGSYFQQFFESRRVYSPPLGASLLWTQGTQYTAPWGGEIYS